MKVHVCDVVYLLNINNIFSICTMQTFKSLFMTISDWSSYWILFFFIYYIKAIFINQKKKVTETGILREITFNDENNVIVIISINFWIKFIGRNLDNISSMSINFLCETCTGVRLTLKICQ